MRRAQLGESGLSVSAIGLGVMPMSDSYGAPEPAEVERALNRALDIGLDFLDTADIYAAGANEELLGRVLGARRDEYTLATKFGNALEPGGPRICGRPDYVSKACDASLKRLGTDRIDLYYLHRLDPQVPIEDTVGAMAELVSAGKVRHLGLSEVSATTLRRACKVHPIAALQSEYSLWTRSVEDSVLPACRELGVGLVPFCPLGRAIFTGRIRAGATFAKEDTRSRQPRFQPENLTANLAMIEAYLAYAETTLYSPAQLALAWLRAKGADIVPIPGTKRTENIELNAAAGDIALTEKQVSKLESIIDPERIQGQRYDSAALELIDPS